MLHTRYGSVLFRYLFTRLRLGRLGSCSVVKVVKQEGSWKVVAISYDQSKRLDDTTDT